MLVIIRDIASSYLSMELGVHLRTVITEANGPVVTLANGLTISCHKASKSAQLRRCFMRIAVVLVDSSGLAMTEQCSLLLVRLTIPAT